MEIVSENEASQRRELPEGVFWRGRVLWIRFTVHRRELREPTKARTAKQASRIRQQRIAEYERGERTTYTRTLRVNDLMDAVLTNYETSGYNSLPTARSASAKPCAPLSDACSPSI